MDRYWAWRSLSTLAETGETGGGLRTDRSWAVETGEVVWIDIGQWTRPLRTESERGGWSGGIENRWRGA
jgi:hypothetical protein